jgi:CheY-like chemotaxis protein
MTNPLQILLVEDHPDTRNLLAGYLRSAGHKVRVTSTMREAIAALGQQQWDLLLSDLGLPDGNGWEMLRAAGDDRVRLAVAMSGFGTGDDKASSRAAGFHEHLIKPVDQDLVDAVLARAQAARRTASRPDVPGVCGCTGQGKPSRAGDPPTGVLRVGPGPFGADTHRFVRRPLDGPWPADPSFGGTDGRFSSTLHAKHLAHHLRQFYA